MKYVDGLGRNAPDYRLVKADVQRVLDENSIIEPPVSPREIAENYGLAVLFARFPPSLSNVMGFFDLNENHIVVNIDDHPNRQTFTIAHELGHFRLHREYIKSHPDAYKVLMRSPLGEQKDVMEQEANAFAANLLIPRKMLEKYISIAAQSELAKLFNVSEEVVRWRIKNENLIPA